VCPEEDVYQAIQLALHEDITLVAFGDMLRVPVNVAKSEIRSLEQAKGAGADIRPVASPTEVVQIARDQPNRDVVFFAAGFETTTAPVAGMLAEGVPHNLSLLLSGRLTWPAVAMLLNSDTPGFDCLIAPGHVGTVMGPEEWEFVVTDHNIPAAMAGFTPVSLLAAMYSVLRQQLEQRPFLDNCYPELVRPGGNPAARRMLEMTLRVVDANWRGVGVIPNPATDSRLTTHTWMCAHASPITPIPHANAPARCHRVATAQRWCSDASIPTNADSMAAPVTRATRSVRAWSPMRTPAASGGAAACASRSRSQPSLIDWLNTKARNER
jgi:hydrogenase expression/formation protein HypD